MNSYKLLKYIIATNRLNLKELKFDERIPEFSADIIQYIITNHSPEKEERFQIDKKKNGSVFLFHGSARENWYSIIRNGVRNLNPTHMMMTEGAAYGVGVYASSYMQTSMRYSGEYRGNISCSTWAGGKYTNYLVMGIIEVIKLQEYSKGREWNIATIPNDKHVALRYLLLIPSSGSCSQSVISTKLNLEKHYANISSKYKSQREAEKQVRIKEALKNKAVDRKKKEEMRKKYQKEKEEAFKKDEEEKKFSKMEMQFIAKGNPVATKRIFSEYKSLMQSNEFQDVKITFRDPDSIYIWRLKFDILKFELSKELKKDFETVKKKKGEAILEFEVIFSDGFPFEPPFVRVVTPKFQFHTGHVTIGGSICMEVLTPSGWSAAINLENVFVDILAHMCSGGARLEKQWDHEYTLMEAKEAFQRVARQHNWL